MTHRPEDQPDRTPEDAAPEEALRAADPAASAAELDLSVLRAEVDRRIAAEAAGAVSVEGSAATADAPAEQAEVTPIRTRRPARWLQVAAAVAAVAVVGAGSYALGATGGEQPTPAAAPISLNGSGAVGSLEVAGAADSPVATTDMRIAPSFGGRTVFTASGLTDDAGTGHGWALDAAATFSAETAARVAAALGVAGEPRLEWGAWTVGPDDGSGPTVSVQPDGTTGVSYYDPTRDPWSCTVSGTDLPDGGASSDGTAAEGSVAIDPVAPTCDPAAGPAPTGDAALDLARGALRDLGVDPASFALTVDDSGDQSRATTVTALHVVDGQQTGLMWSFTVVPDGVQALYGFLAPLVDLGEYPVIGAASAVERLGDPRFGPSSGAVMPYARTEAADDASSMVAPDPSAEPTVPATVRPGAAIDWPVQHVTITSARLGVSQVTQTDGSALLVPAYELTGSDGSVWSVIAVAEESLDLG